MSSSEFTIRELAEEFDITTRTLRFYEEKGLLNPSRSGQVRHYSAADRTRLRLILRGKRLGLTLDESRDIIDMYQPSGSNQAQLESLIAKIEEKQIQLENQKRDIDATLEDLKNAKAQCLSALETK